MRLGCGEPSLVIGNSWLITWQLLPLLRQSWKKKPFSYRHLRHGEDNKEVLLGHGEKRAWQLWSEKVKQFKKRRQQGAAPSFISEMEVLGQVLNGVKRDESCIQVEYLQSREEVARLHALKREQLTAEACASQCWDGALAVKMSLPPIWNVNGNVHPL